MNTLSRLVLLMTLLVAHGLTTTAAAATLAADWQEAVTLAKRDKRDLVVLLTGSDWDRGSAAVASLVRDAAFLRACGDAVVVVIDHPDYPTDAQKTLRERNKDFKLTFYRYPVLLTLDLEQRLVGALEGATGEVPTAAAHLSDWRNRRERRDRLLAQAGKASGVRRAELLGEALDQLEDNVARRHYGKILDQIRTADPEDETGYLGKYRFNANALVEKEIWSRLKERKYAEAIAFLEKLQANRRLLTSQRQELLAMQHAVYRTWPEHAAESRKALEKLIALDPRSDVAVGARKRLDDILLRETVTALREAVQKAQAGTDVAALAQAQERYLRVAQHDHSAGQLPKVPAPPGWLVSAEGRCTFSSISRSFGEPWRHFLILRDVAPGGFHTNRERRPYVQVELPRPRSLTAIVVVNHHNNGGRQVPLRIQVSADGTTWQEVFRSDRGERFWRVDFADKRPLVRHVRVSRDDDREEFFHLSNVLIYGE